MVELDEFSNFKKGKPTSKDNSTLTGQLYPLHHTVYNFDESLLGMIANWIVKSSTWTIHSTILLRHLNNGCYNKADSQKLATITCDDRFNFQTGIYISWIEMSICWKEMFICWIEMFICWTEMLIRWTEMFIRWTEMFICWTEMCCLLLSKRSAWFIFITITTQHVVSFEIFIFNNKQMAPLSPRD